MFGTHTLGCEFSEGRDCLLCSLYSENLGDPRHRAGDHETSTRQLGWLQPLPSHLLGETDEQEADESQRGSSPCPKSHTQRVKARPGQE